MEKKFRMPNHPAGHLLKASKALGFLSVNEMVERYSMEYNQPGICTNCGLINTVEPDTENCTCPYCGKRTINSMNTLIFYANQVNMKYKLKGCFTN